MTFNVHFKRKESVYNVFKCMSPILIDRNTIKAFLSNNQFINLYIQAIKLVSSTMVAKVAVE